MTVLLILGVLAAVTMPRYAEVQGRAREAKVRALAGSMKSAAGLVKASALAAGVPCSAATGTTVTMEGSPIALNHCHPTPSATFGAGILAAARVPPADGWTASGGGAAPGDTLVLQLSDATTPADCSVSYKSAAGTATPPEISFTLSGC